MRATRGGRFAAIAAAVAALAAPAAGEPLSRRQVPAPLEPWVDWVLRGHESELCPFLHGQPGARACVWPSRVDLDLRERGGSFAQEWLVLEDAWVSLPGDTRLWPLEVRAGGAPLPVVEREGRPAARLTRGWHSLGGSFAWDAMPELIQVPPETGIVRLRLGGREVAFPNRDAQGRLWLQPREAEQGAEERLVIRVNRRVVDEVPLLLETRLELQVAGRSREVVLGRALPDGFVPLSLSSPLPARLDPDGRLRVQARPGRHPIALVARHRGPVASLALPEPGGPWAQGEVWVFEARPELRLVSVEDGVAVDPTQTTLPDEWRRLPAYRMEPGRGLRLAEKRRGDSDPAPDRLALSRVWWLDFDGAGYTLSDRIEGEVSRSSRLEMGPGTHLGRVALGGRDQLITRLGDSDLTGVEVPRGAIDLVADSRVPWKGAGLVARELPAVGWDHDFQQLQGRLQLPPGWRLLHASGVDRAATTWIERWTLLDLFAVLVLGAAFLRLWGGRWGALAFLGLGLSWTEPGAPHWAWAAVLSAEALRRVLPAARFPRFGWGLWLTHAASLAALILIAIPFAVGQLRSGLYPALERPHAAVGARQAVEEVRILGMEAPADAELAMEPSPGALGKARELASAERVASSAEAKRGYLDYAPDPDAKITTGPGVPGWRWTEVTLVWSGPVGREQKLRLLLVPPAANGALALVRVGLLAALVLCALGAGARPGGGMRRAGGGMRRAGGMGMLRPAGALLPLLLAAGAGDARAELPSQEMLDELRRRLLEAPECHPSCASSPRLILEVEPGSLRARFEVDVQAETAVPLPGGARSFEPSQVLVDGRPARGLLRAADGALFAELPPGRHQLWVEGPLPERDSVELPLPLRPRRVEARVRGWTLHGLHEEGQAEASLQLTRLRAVDAGRSLEPAELPPFVRVERRIELGLEWQVSTRVTRVSPPDAALVLEVPLVAGESVTTPGIRASGGSALVSLAPGVPGVAWASALEPRAELSLAASRELPIAESWQVDASPVWHLEADGIPPVQSAGRLREWRPWPGEELTLRVGRPEAVEGETATIDASELALEPGLRATDAALALDVRTSRGGPHLLTLPEGAEVSRVAIDGVPQPLRPDGRELRVPLRPGAQRIELAWREPRGAGRLLFRSSEVDLGLPGVDAEIRIRPSVGRWILLVGGPSLGPAVLFWPLCAVLAAVALALGRLSLVTRLTPLGFSAWLLLAVGLSQVPVAAAALVVAWPLALGWRARHGVEVPGRWFDLVQLALVGLTLVALGVLFFAIQQGLLGEPRMQIAGNGSSGGLLRWYQDRSGAALPRPWVLSVPLWVYRLAMLAWALWLAIALVAWLRWAWTCFSAGEIWRPLRRARVAGTPPGA